MREKNVEHKNKQAVSSLVRSYYSLIVRCIYHLTQHMTTLNVLLLVKDGTMCYQVDVVMYHLQ
jgi:hypothetical protein